MLNQRLIPQRQEFHCLHEFLLFPLNTLQASLLSLICYAILFHESFLGDVDKLQSHQTPDDSVD